MKRIFLEALIVTMVGAGLAFVANGVSRKRIEITRNYFPEAASPPKVSVSNDAATNLTFAIGSLAEELRRKGLQLADSHFVTQLFHDPRRDQGLVIFIDARDAEHYRAGHIPAAYSYDYYQQLSNLASILPLCQVASEIVIYCNGGKCEDSENLAGVLSAAGIAKEKMYVYGGGIAEWTANGLPVELGDRQSGNLQKSR